MKRLVSILLASLLLGLVPAAQAEAITFKNCTELRKTYKHGVSLNKNAINKGAGPIYSPRVNPTVYRLNTRLDLDRDNIICEVVKPKPKPAVIPTPTPTPTPIPTPTPTPTQPPKDLSAADVITKTSDLSDPQICRTSDLTPRPDVSNGFPRPANARTGTLSARILYVPVNFTDLPFADRDLELIRLATDAVTEFYKKTSFGKVSISYEFLKKEHWVQMTRTADSYNLLQVKPQQHNGELVREVIRMVDSSVDFSLYDGVVVASGYSSSTGAGEGFPGFEFPARSGVAKGVSLEVGRSIGSFSTMAHEIGHSLFGLEDLYVFLNDRRPSVADPNPAGPWDMMSNSAREFFGWSKLLNGWLEPGHVRCLTSQQRSVHYIESIAQPGTNPKLVLINLSEGVTIAIETRPYGSRKGMLVYKVDSRIAHGDGPILAPKGLQLLGWGPVSIDGWTVRPIDEDPNGLLIEVVKP